MIQTSKYTVFCRVVELGSFSLAAEELGYTQSSVSQKVLSLEEELGVTLLLRQKKPSGIDIRWRKSLSLYSSHLCGGKKPFREEKRNRRS